ncbi:molybdate ABC transporter substrate-binding protein [Maliponia aquimaris]|uniref:Molybdate-binding periplasmic protein n=1 Tax=Maliponia aquimaris TaxID=1673631 RepID=A0A238K830_9RHOB|nr:molybdate ABC transporter substrate-binding protein [Maliponia aquimaris]SMX38647.1 Molybdate-binding periplasmic protein precursor [Maliponia aquimaris]
MPLTRRAFGASALAFGLTGARPAAAQDGPPIVAAASDLRYAVEEIAAAFRAETGQEVLLSFGSTGNFARQIREGAPFQLFMAADERFVLDLARDGHLRDEGALYALGRLALAVPNAGSTLQPDGTLADLRTALAQGRVTRFAIANPDHAPYGMRAQEALQHAGLWEPLQPLLVLGENVSQAAQFALSGNADGGLIAWSLALAPQLQEQGRFALVPADWHQPLLQRMALTRNAGPVAQAFYTYIQQPEARAIMARYGFTLPE